MGVTNFQIVFDNATAIYYSGQNVAGQIILTVDEPLDIRGVVIRITGSAEVDWKETHSHKHTERDHRGKKVTRHTTQTITFCSHEVYFEDKYYVIGGPDGKIVILPGQHVYTFQKHLRPNLPSNFEGTFGSIRYSVEASLDRAWKIDNKCLALFTVITPIDLRTHPTAPLPIKRVQEKKFSYVWRSAGNMLLTISLPFGGYVSGQDIPITVCVENTSEVEVAEITCRLRQTIDFHAKQPHPKTKREKASLGVARFNSVAPMSLQTMTQSLSVPLMPSYNVLSCSVIDMSFDLKFEVRVGMFHRDVEVRIPLVIGTIPVGDVRVLAANSDGISMGAMGAFTPGGSQCNPHGSHAGMMAGTPSDHNGAELPPSYDIAVRGSPMEVKSKS